MGRDVSAWQEVMDLNLDALRPSVAFVYRPVPRYQDVQDNEGTTA